MNNNYTNALDLLDEAAEAVEMAVELLRQVQAEVPALRHRMDAYLISTLEQALSDNNEWLGGSNSANIASLRIEVNELAANEDEDAEGDDEPSPAERLKEMIRQNAQPRRADANGNDDRS